MNYLPQPEGVLLRFLDDRSRVCGYSGAWREPKGALTNEFVTYHQGKTIRTVVVPKDGERVAVA